MPKERSPNSLKAEDMYLKGNGKIELSEIAKTLGIPEGTVRSWKNRYRWGEKINATLQKKKRNATDEKKSNKKKIKTEKNNTLEVHELTEMQRLFCEIYVKNFNATQAAVKAGYSTDTAHVQGPRLLGNVRVREYINYLKELKKQSIMLTEDDIVERYMRIAFADMGDFVEFGQKDMPVMTSNGPIFMIDPKTMQRILVTQRVNTLIFKEDFEVDGGLICEIKVGKQGASLKLEDRQKALDWLANYFEMNPEHKYRKLHDERKLQLERERFEHQKEMDEKNNW